MLQRRGDKAGAAAAFAEAERLNQRKADAQAATFAVSVGLERLRANDLDGAIERFRAAVRLAPDYPEAHYHLGVVLEKQGAHAEARQHIAEARRLNPRLRARR
jgi:Flp pilus assembly protein TadD